MAAIESITSNNNNNNKVGVASDSMATDEVSDNGVSNDTGGADHDRDEARRRRESGRSRSSTYRQRYKRAWELDSNLKDWLTGCRSDPFSAFCRYCRTKLHAHKKGLLAHAKSTKHKKHLSNFPADYGPDLLNESFDNIDDGQQLDGRDSPGGGERDARGNKLYRGYRTFKDAWLKDPSFSEWLRKVPSNRTKALCIACRCVVTAGRCELIKHSQAAKHARAIADGPFEEVGEAELQWLDTHSSNFDSRADLVGHSAMSANSIAIARAPAIDLPGLLVDDVIKRLGKHVPLELAEKWDNVGIITQPVQPLKVNNILLTIDLNEKIVNEAIKKRVQLIIAYHPPIFTPTKSLQSSRWKDKVILMCVENKITVYSPHTALDAVKGGINDWLISSFMEVSGENVARPIYYSESTTNTHCLEALLSESQEVVANALKEVHNVTMTDYGNSSTDVRVACNEKTLPDVIEKLAASNCAQVYSRVVKLSGEPIPGIGMGRVVTMGTALPLYEVIQRTKTHLDLTYVRLALSPKHTRDTRVKSIAVCAGSGSSVLKCCRADVWITGEMSHHDVLDAINKGTTVILCEHSNTERGFLRDWCQQLKTTVFEDQVMVNMSEYDRDPLRIV